MRRAPAIAARLALALGAFAGAMYGLVKLAEPGGGVFAHATYLGRVALMPSRCAPLSSAPLGAQRALSVCLTFGGDTRRALLEWIAFHRLQGVQRFDVFWDVVTEPINAQRHAEFLEALREFGGAEYSNSSASGGTADVFAWTRGDIGRLVARIAAASAEARLRVEGGCAMSDQDLADLSARAAECLKHGGWLCQGAVNAVCLAAAKVRGDEWIGLFDVDEFMFAPGRPGREDECFWGGASGRGGLGRRSDVAGCVVPAAEAPLLAGRDLVSVLRDSYSLIVSSVVVEGVAFGLAGSGPNGTGPRTGLVTEAHGLSAGYDAEGLLLPPPGFSRESCPGWFCGLCTPKKSFVRVLHAPIDGLRVHQHDTGPFAVERPAPGAVLRLNRETAPLHCYCRQQRLRAACCLPLLLCPSLKLEFADYPFDDIPGVLAKGSRGWYRDVAENRDGIADFLNAAPDESARALVPLLRRCMEVAHGRDPECRRTAA
jgi:hypothetical protein